MDSFSFIVKIASRCNLNCTYCYMYNMGDTSYLVQPKVMSEETVQHLATRINTFGFQHGLSEVSIILHGGEPLLAGKAFFRRFMEIFKDCIDPSIAVTFLVQTNALLIDEGWMELFSKLNIILGISLDGDEAANDKYRIDHQGKGSYTRVMEKYQLAKNSVHAAKAPAVLTVINIDADPVELYRHHKLNGISSFDVLFPHANWDKVPEEPSPGTRFYQSETPYADWLIMLFEEWFKDSNENKRPKIRKFNQIIQVILGFKVSADDLGGGDNSIMVIETNGAYEAGDALKICGPDFTKANTHVAEHEIDEGLHTELASLYFKSHQHLCRECESCRIRHICGGGYLPHRYHTVTKFNNPSVYCMDLTKFISHVQNRIVDSMSDDTEQTDDIKRYNYQEVLTNRAKEPRDFSGVAAAIKL